MIVDFLQKKRTFIVGINFCSDIFSVVTILYRLSVEARGLRYCSPKEIEIEHASHTLSVSNPRVIAHVDTT